MTTRYVCVHGHFYQPPRESPWLEAVEPEDSAYPYHDWNVRITEECYGPNSASRILSGEGQIEEIVNNYASMSFNFGPTLLSWLETHATEVYEKVLEADRMSQEMFSGHGSAMAQAYNHMIMPLASGRDKRTQVRWGVEDFISRFGRKPEGMWLPETAVDTATLEALADAGIRFTVLAPHQAARIRAQGEEAWHELPPEGIDTSQAYRAPLPSGKEIVLFFYDGGLSRAVAFEQLLDNGEVFASRLANQVPPNDGRPTLSHIATDGETYGHHHRFGDMGLAWALKRLAEGKDGVRLTNYPAFLDICPPQYEVQIRENTSWSCAHGVARWQDDCGCTTGGRPGWNQKWRRPLRDALDAVRDTVERPFEELAGKLLADPWAARDGYISVILDRQPENVMRFLEQHRRPDAPFDAPTVLKLMELQRHAMLMYTSCGFFFDDVSRIETVQIMKYVARVSQLAWELFGLDVETPFLQTMEKAVSNVRSEGTGASVYRRRVQPSQVDLATVTGHYAVASLFEGQPEQIYCYRAEQPNAHIAHSGSVTLSIGTVRIASEITWETRTFTYGALHFGDHHVSAGVRALGDTDTASFDALREETQAAFTREDLLEVTRVLSAYFVRVTISLRDLFRDEQRRILTRIVDSAISDAEDAYQRVYERHGPLMRFLSEIEVPLPAAFGTSVRFILYEDLRRCLSSALPDVERVGELLDEAQRFHVTFDDQGLSLAFADAIERLAAEVKENPGLAAIQRLASLVSLTGRLSAPVPLWKTQNTIFAAKDDLMAGDGPDRKAWHAAVQALAGELDLRLEAQ